METIRDGLMVLKDGSLQSQTEAKENITVVQELVDLDKKDMEIDNMELSLSGIGAGNGRVEKTQDAGQLNIMHKGCHEDLPVERDQQLKSDKSTKKREWYIQKDPQAWNENT